MGVGRWSGRRGWRGGSRPRGEGRLRRRRCRRQPGGRSRSSGPSRRVRLSTSRRRACRHRRPGGRRRSVF
jgi:hypothetical protein